MFTDDEGNKWQAVQNGNAYTLRPLKPVKKTEETCPFQIYMRNGLSSSSGTDYVSKTIITNPTTANKLSEAISALVEYVTTGGDANNDRLVDLALEAARSFQESQ